MKKKVFKPEDFPAKTFTPDVAFEHIPSCMGGFATGKEQAEYQKKSGHKGFIPTVGNLLKK